jgi:hypothetical protein
VRGGGRRRLGLRVLRRHRRLGRDKRLFLGRVHHSLGVDFGERLAIDADDR